MIKLLAQQTFEYPENYVPPSLAIGLLIPILAIVVVSVIGWWKMFEKAGQPGWAAIVPIYNIYILLKIAEKPAWWMLALLLAWIPVLGGIISLIFSIVVGIEVAKKFGKDAVWGAILNGVLGIGYLILGFGSARYQGAITPKPPANTPAAT